jgi:hypothetical protein
MPFRRRLSATLLLCAAGPLHAADWTVTPYLWIASFDGSIGGAASDGSGDGESTSFDHLWDNLGLAGAMLNGSVREGRWTAFGDWTYAKVTSENPTRVPGAYESAEAELRGNVVQAFAGYDLLGRDRTHLDVFAGLRYYDIDVSLELRGAALASRSFEGDEAWTDAVVGARWVADVDEHWQLYVLGDAGTGGSDLSWQLVAAAGYRFSWGSALAGWRHLDADYETGTYRLDAALSGPFLGVGFTFPGID